MEIKKLSWRHGKPLKGRHGSWGKAEGVKKYYIQADEGNRIYSIYLTDSAYGNWIPTGDTFLSYEEAQEWCQEDFEGEVSKFLEEPQKEKPHEV